MTDDRLAEVTATLQIVKGLENYDLLEKPLRYMYERIDGSGPEKLTDVPASAQVLGLAIDFDALVTSESAELQPSERRENALTQIQNASGTRYDGDAVKALVAVCHEGKA
jgi:response regulator RpfG family c-di-GMP phosphodiesterase